MSNSKLYNRVYRVNKDVGPWQDPKNDSLIKQASTDWKQTVWKINTNSCTTKHNMTFKLEYSKFSNPSHDLKCPSRTISDSGISWQWHIAHLVKFRQTENFCRSRWSPATLKRSLSDQHTDAEILCKGIPLFIRQLKTKPIRNHHLKVFAVECLCLALMKVQCYEDQRWSRLHPIHSAHISITGK